MRTLESYLSEYAESHQHPLNIKIHNICVPAIAWSLLGFLHTFKLNPDLSVAHVLAVLGLIYYSLFKNWKFLALMTASMVISFISFEFIPHLRIVSIVVFAVAWVGQFYGHHVEGKKPSFFKDIFFLLIGPAWVAVKAFPKINQPAK